MTDYTIETSFKKYGRSHYYNTYITKNKHISEYRDLHQHYEEIIFLKNEEKYLKIINIFPHSVGGPYCYNITAYDYINNKKISGAIWINDVDDDKEYDTIDEIIKLCKKDSYHHGEKIEKYFKEENF